MLLGLYTVLAVRGLTKGAPFQPEEKWKPLDNPRNRDLVRKCCKKDSLSFVCLCFLSQDFLSTNIQVRGFSNYALCIANDNNWISILQSRCTP